MTRHALIPAALVTAGLAAVTIGACTGAPYPVDTLKATTTVDATTVPVTRVVDGDTFDVPEGRVRVLVMDSCEKGTAGGTRATADAHRLLDGKSVKLTSEPGHDRDRYGRLLRYVTLPGGADYADTMLRESHTAVYAKRSDASPARTAEGRANDPDGRTC